MSHRENIQKGNTTNTLSVSRDFWKPKCNKFEPLLVTHMRQGIRFYIYYDEISQYSSHLQVNKATGGRSITELEWRDMPTLVGLSDEQKLSSSIKGCLSFLIFSYLVFILVYFIVLRYFRRHILLKYGLHFERKPNTSFHNEALLSADSWSAQTQHNGASEFPAVFQISSIGIFVGFICLRIYINLRNVNIRNV